MNELSEKLLSAAENELADKEKIRSSVLGSGRERARSVRKWALPIAACIALALITVFAIPSARAEVLSWFGAKTPEEYLADPENRRPVEALEQVIVKSAETEGQGVEAGSVTDNRLVYAADEPVWQSIADDFSIELGETLVDGEKMYLSVKLNGLSALPELDKLTGGSGTRTTVPLDELPMLFQSGQVPKVFRDGAVSFYSEAETDIWIVLNDGTELDFIGLTTLMHDPEVQQFVSDMRAKYLGDNEYYTDDRTPADVSAETAEWLEGKSFISTVHFDLSSLTYYGASDPLEFLSRYADGNGMIEAKVVYRASAYPYYPFDAHKKYEAELGTARFDIKAFHGLESAPLTAEGPSVLASRSVKLSYCEWIETANSMDYAVTNLAADLEGVSFTLKEGAYINGLGIQDVVIRVSFPDSWTNEQRTAFAQGVSFRAEANGQEFHISGFTRTAVGEGEYEFRLGHIGMPYEMVKDLAEVRIVPLLNHVDYVCSNESGRQAISIGDTVIVPEFEDKWFEGGEPIVLSDGVLTLLKQN